MKKLLSALLITLVGASVQAQNKPLACQMEESAGLRWENGRWVSSYFVPKPSKFILVQTGNTLTIESVAKVLNNPTVNLVTCRYVAPETACIDITGSGLYFNPKVLKGGISKLFGSTTEGPERDTLNVQVFSCTPF